MEMLGFLRSKFRKESVRDLLLRLHHDEQGAEGLEKLLIIAALVLPLLGLLMWYRDDIADWVAGIWEQRKSEGDAGDRFSPGGSNR
jgi:hypothetical protein